MPIPVTPSEIKAFVPAVTAKVCEALTKALLAFPLAIYRNFNYMFDSAGLATTEFKHLVNFVQPGDLIYSAASSTSRTDRLLCNGQAVSRTTYADLFTAVGTTFGIGDGSSTFNVPNFTDRFPLAAAGGTTTLGATGGATTHTMTLPELVPHTHTMEGQGAADATNNTPDLIIDDDTSGNPQTKETDSTGGEADAAVPFSIMPPWIGVYVWIQT